jgi:YbgC/YbaW family acyl-CoA thioester hydrolase
MSRHTYECHVRFSDVDVYGHVNNVKYFEYYQEARIAFLRALTESEHESSLRQVVARIDVDYKRPILFRPEPYLVESWVTGIGTSSYGLDSLLDLPGEAGGLRHAHPAIAAAHGCGTVAPRAVQDAGRGQLGLLEGVHHELRGVGDVVPELCVQVGRQVGLVETGPEVLQPVLLGQRRHRERCVPHA